MKKAFSFLLLLMAVIVFSTWQITGNGTTAETCETVERIGRVREIRFCEYARDWSTNFIQPNGCFIQSESESERRVKEKK